MPATLRDAIYGLAVGDALGVPAEFQKRGTYVITDMVGGGCHSQPKGTWSDDTSMTLASCDSIRVQGRIDCEDILCRFRKWYYAGDYTVDGVAFDIGNTVAAALDSGKGQTSVSSNGNGSLMRSIPLAFVRDISDPQIRQVSAITHAHKISEDACVLYVRYAQDLMRGGNPNQQDLTTGRTPCQALSRFSSCAAPFERLATINTLDENDIKSSGYVVDTLEAALWCLTTTSDFASCVLMAVNLGEDTDTIAAVAGGLAGIVYGDDAIPARWLAELRGKELIEACLF